MTESRREQRVLLVSTALTVALAVGGVVVGLLAGSMAIVFDGLFSFIDVAMSVIALFVARLVVREADRRFQYGYWHIEPMALAFNGGMLVLLCLYAFVNAVGSLLSGGSEVVLGWALGYSAAAAVLGFGMWWYERRANRTVESEFISLDLRSWLMTGAASAALLVAFVVAWALQRSTYAYLAPYVDPAVLAVLSLAFVALPVGTLKHAVSEVLLMAPAELDASVRAALDAIVAEHGFLGYTSYVAKVGRGRFIEVNLLMEPDRDIGTARALDEIRSQIADALDARWPQAWLTVNFTADEAWT